MRPGMRWEFGFFGIGTKSRFLLGAKVFRVSEKISFWFNPKTGKVEQGPQSLAVDRYGPFETFAEAARAEQIIAERARKIREEEELED